MTDTRSSLLQRVRDPADAESWREFVALYEPLLFSYARSRGLAEHDARDVVQDLFVKLLHELPRFELNRDRGRFRTWLWQITCNAIVDRARREQRQARAEDGWRDAHPAGEEPEADWLAAYRQRVLDFALQQVRAQAQPKTWACFELHVLNGRTRAEAAAQLGLTANAVAVNASRILAKVREQCAAYLEELGDDADHLPGGP